MSSREGPDSARFAVSHPVMLECRGVERHFGGLHVLDGLSVSVHGGRVTGLVGANGAGKTTLFDVISGFLLPSAGEVSFEGERIDGRPPWRVAQLGIGRLFQNVRLFKRLSVLDNVLVAIPDQAGESPFNALFRRRRVHRQEQANTAEALRWLTLVGLADHMKEPAEQLSHGEQRLLAIARLLACGARCLLLDEPTAGVQPAMAQRLLDLIRSLAREQGKAVFVIEHDMAAIAHCADELHFMDQGRIIAYGDPHSLLADRSLRATYLGL